MSKNTIILLKLKKYCVIIRYGKHNSKNFQLHKCFELLPGVRMIVENYDREKIITQIRSIGGI
ncbi:hypothetical protein SDC9_71380 [bioreactor metagenome]|uniref:Uncharacterized protein n=1 Tax=bioreactor metagenome TaxID=1076179 RepID=A0A644Y8E9_9ZZZZ